MTNVQLLLTIGIPSLLIVLSWITNNSRFDRIEKRLDPHDARFNEILAATHRDALEILRSMTALHERVAVVGTKQNS
jgi:hypothetical protein